VRLASARLARVSAEARLAHFPLSLETDAERRKIERDGEVEVTREILDAF
jgi:hypothetical protein